VHTVQAVFDGFKVLVLRRLNTHGTKNAQILDKLLQKDAFGPAFCKDIQQLTEQSRMNKDPFKQLPQQCLNLLFIHSMPFRGDYITHKEYFTIQKSNILFMEYCYAILQCVQIGHGLLHCPFRNFRDGLFCSGQGEAVK